MMVLRYKLIQELTGGENPAITRLSRVCLVLACLSCLGLTMVANFQVSIPTFEHETINLCPAELFVHLKLELQTQFPPLNDVKDLFL